MKIISHFKNETLTTEIQQSLPSQSENFLLSVVFCKQSEKDKIFVYLCEISR